MTADRAPAPKTPTDVARTEKPRDVGCDVLRSEDAGSENKAESLSAAAFRIRTLNANVDESGGH